MTTRTVIILVGGVLLATLLQSPLHAQSAPVSVTADVDRTTVARGETVTLSVTVIGAEPMRPQLPALDDFEVLNSSSGTQISIHNGSVNLQFTYHYTLLPQRAGDLQIDAVVVVADNQTYTTEPITLRVTDNAPTPTPADTPTSPANTHPSRTPDGDLFVEAAIDNSQPYLGQQLMYTFRFYRAVTAFGRPRYNAPDFSGFWNQQEESEAQSMVRSGGQYYELTELKTVLFPTVAGARTIEPATIRVPGSLLSPDVTLQTEPITLTVRPHPSPAPDRFTGAVGQLTIAAHVDITQTVVNEPVQLRITLEGSGNIDAWLAPQLPDLPDWRVFDSSSDVVTQLRDERLVGRRVYEYLLTPTRAGEFTLPPVEYSYFDPESHSYQTVASAPIELAVEPGAVSASPTAAAPATAPTTAPTTARATTPVTTSMGEAGLAAPTASPAVAQVPRNIGSIKPVPVALQLARSPLVENRLYQLAWLIPLLLLGADYGWQWQRRRRGRTPGWRHRSQARRRARRTLAQARKEQQEPSKAASRVLLTYLADKLDTATIGLTHARLAAHLHERGVSDDLIRRVQHLLARSDAMRFAPAGSSARPVRGAAAHLLDDTEEIIAELEKTLRH